MSEPQILTNPGKSENVARQASLADAIAANLTSGRQGAGTADLKEQPAREPERAPIEEVSAAPETDSEDREQQSGEDNQQGSVEAEEVSNTYRLADFAEAAEISEKELLKRLEVEVQEGDTRKTTTLEDVLNSHQFVGSTTKRAQEIAEQRRQLDARVGEVSQMHERADAVLQVQWNDANEKEQALDHQYRAVNWAALQAKQDGSYADMEAQFSRARQELTRDREKLQNAYTEVQRQKQALFEKQQAEAVPQAREKLFDLIPEWRDESRAQREAVEAGRHMIDRYGLTPEEVNKANDPRMIAAMRRLWVLEQQASGVPLAEKKVKKAPKVVKPGQAAERQGAKQERLKQLRGRLKRSGKRNDLAALVLESRIRGK